jgi:5-methylcytosine-specific restriction enzyme subunit McrC
VTVWIAPKVPISRLLWLLGWARNEVFVAPGPVSLDEEQELVPALADAFCSLSERPLREPLLQGYRDVETAEPVLRGRLRTEDQMRRRYGLPTPLLVRYDDYLADIAENQIIKAAATRLLIVPGLKNSARTRLRRLRGLLSDVSDLRSGKTLPRWLPSRLNARYVDALWLAETIFRKSSVEQIPGRMRLDGFLLDLFRVFEEFVTSTLGDALEDRGGTCTKQDPFSLDEGNSISIKPDLVWRIAGRSAAVVDAKYKAERPGGFPQADLYQAHAYATAYGLRRAHLVYAQGNEVARSWTVRNSGVQITAHTLNLDKSPDEILEQVDGLANVICADSVAWARLHGRPLDSDGEVTRIRRTRPRTP